MKRLYLLIAVVAVLAYAGWRMGYINLPRSGAVATDTAAPAGGGPGAGGGGRRGGCTRRGGSCGTA